MRNRKRTTLPSLIMLSTLAIFFASCTHRYVAKPYDIALDKVPAFNVGNKIAIIHDQPDTSDKLFYAQGFHKYMGSLHQCTEIAIQELNKELTRRGGIVTSDAPKQLKISVTSASVFMGFARFTGKIYLKVTTGDGYTNNYEGSNATPGTVYRALNGAIALAVAEVLKDETVQRYLTQ